MRLRIKYRRQPPCEPELEVFRSIAVHRQSRWRSSAASVTVHLLLLGLVALAGETNRWEPATVRAHYKLEIIRLQVPDPIYFRANATHPSETAGSDRRQKMPTPAAPAAGSSEPKAVSAAAPRLELPDVREIRKDQATIIEPDFHPQRQQPNVPTLAFWAAQQPERPKPTRKLLTPGSPEKAVSRPMLDAVPVPEIPNRQPVASDLNIALSRTPPAAALPLAPSTTAPIRLRDRTPVAAGPSFDASPGEPVNVIAISKDRAPAKIVELVAGLQTAATASGATALGGGASGGAPSGGSKPDAPKSPGAGQQPPSTSTVRNDAASPRGVTATGPAATADGLVQSSAGVVNPDKDQAPGRSTTAVTRITHPVNGVFDVVIMQSATRDDVPELRGLLSGNPVYSVYLPVGAEKEWLLQYCLPGRGRSGDSVYQVNIDDSAGISPPYPVLTVIPNNILGVAHQKQIILHGVLTLAGTLREVKTTDGANGLAGQILALLGDWRFRPALKNKLAVDVEVILIIPPVG